MLDFDTWSGLYNRLCAAKEHTRNAEQSRALYDALREFPSSCVQQAMFRASREVNGWPKSDRLVQLAQDERRKFTTNAVVCELCHGEIWVNAPDQPIAEFGGQVYANYVDWCPQCYPNRHRGTA